MKFLANLAVITGFSLFISSVSADVNEDGLIIDKEDDYFTSSPILRTETIAINDALTQPSSSLIRLSPNISVYKLPDNGSQNSLLVEYGGKIPPYVISTDTLEAMNNSETDPELSRYWQIGDF